MKPGALHLALLLGLFVLAACVALNPTANLEPTSIETLEYYPRLVKGYQNTYPSRRVLVLLPSDAREFKEISAEHDPDDGTPAVGVTLDQDGQTVQRLFSPPLGAIVQHALAGAVEESGMIPLEGKGSEYTARRKVGEDYVLASKIVKCWVKKQRGADSRFGPTWRTHAEFALQVTLYKPPFHIAFWQGSSTDSYDDPPVHSAALGPEDLTGIYDAPGQVLSIALTRAVAGLFRQEELHALITQDHPRVR